jgi:hypothetical protein
VWSVLVLCPALVFWLGKILLERENDPTLQFCCCNGQFSGLHVAAKPAFHAQHGLRSNYSTVNNVCRKLNGSLGKSRTSSELLLH